MILQWLRTEYEADVIAFCADLGQGEDLKAIKNKAKPWEPRRSTWRISGKRS